MNVPETRNHGDDQGVGLLIATSGEDTSGQFSLKGGFKTLNLDDSFWHGDQAQEATFGALKDPFRRPTMKKDEQKGPLELSLSMLDQDFSNIGSTLGLNQQGSKPLDPPSQAGGPPPAAAGMNESAPSRLAPYRFDTELMSPRISASASGANHHQKDLKKQQQTQQSQLGRSRTTTNSSPRASNNKKPARRSNSSSKLMENASENNHKNRSPRRSGGRSRSKGANVRTGRSDRNNILVDSSNGGGAEEHKEKDRAEKTSRGGSAKRSNVRRSRSDRHLGSEDKEKPGKIRSGSTTRRMASKSTTSRDRPNDATIELLAKDFPGGVWMQRPSTSGLKRSLTSESAPSFDSSNTKKDADGLLNRSATTESATMHPSKGILKNSHQIQKAGLKRSITSESVPSISDSSSNKKDADADADADADGFLLNRSATTESATMHTTSGAVPSKGILKSKLSRSNTDTAIPQKQRRTGQLVPYSPNSKHTSKPRRKSSSKSPKRSTNPGTGGPRSSARKRPPTNMMLDNSLDSQGGGGSNRLDTSSSSSSNNNVGGSSSNNNMGNSSGKANGSAVRLSRSARTAGTGGGTSSHRNAAMDISNRNTTSGMDNTSSNRHAALDSSSRRQLSPCRRGAPPKTTRKLEASRTGKDVMEERRIAREERQAARREREAAAAEEERRRQQEEEFEQQQKKSSNGGMTRSRSMESINGNSKGMTRTRSMDALNKENTSGDDLPSLTFMSGGEISNEVWKSAGSSKLQPVEESDAERKKKNSAAKVVSKARRLTKAMWGNRIKEARSGGGGGHHNHHNKLLG